MIALVKKTLHVVRCARTMWDAAMFAREGHLILRDPDMRWGERVSGGFTERDIKEAEAAVAEVRELSEFARTLEEIQTMRFFDARQWQAERAA